MAHAAVERQDRRGDISRALYRCINEKGFASTSLKDIAEQAGMSPSHVGYYFDNKASILEYYAAAICRRNTLDLPDLSELDDGRLIDAIATFCMGEGQMNPGLLGVIQELTGLAVHDSALHAIKAEHTVVWRQYLQDFFSRIRPRDGLSPIDAAHLAHAILVGLNTNTLFDRELNREAARRLFLDALRALTSQAPNVDASIRLASATTETEKLERSE